MTKASNTPLRREVTSNFDGELIVEIRFDTVTIRPKRARRGSGSEVTLTWGLVYQLGLTRNLPTRKIRKVRRGTVLS